MGAFCCAFFFFFQAEDGIRDLTVTGVQTCALPISNVNTTVNKLRQVLGDSADQPAFVDTIPRQGYSFIAKIEYVDRPVAPLTSRLSEPAFVAANHERAASLCRTAILSKWLTRGVVVLVIASMLVGSALVLYAQR